VTRVGERKLSVWCEIDAEASGKAAEAGAAEHAVHVGEQFDWGVAMAFFGSAQQQSRRHGGSRTFAADVAEHDALMSIGQHAA